MSTVLTVESARDVRLAWFHYKNVTHRVAPRRAELPFILLCTIVNLLVDDAFYLLLSRSFVLSLSPSIPPSSVSLRDRLGSRGTHVAVNLIMGITIITN